MTISNGDRLLIATTNVGKLREIQAMLAGLPLTIISLSPAFDALEAPEETGETFAENARLKARYYAGVSGLLTVAEDSGLEIEALDGRPGVLSARYPGNDYAERFQNLYAELRARGRERGQARPLSTGRFVCALALASGNDIIFEARGVVEGEIAAMPSGAGGFGYDPIFYYPPYGKTLADVSDEDKALVSHRGAAFRQLRTFIEQSLIDRGLTRRT
jgi:XTP/dITP diphosphohydrolase